MQRGRAVGVMQAVSVEQAKCLGSAIILYTRNAFVV